MGTMELRMSKRIYHENEMGWKLLVVVIIDYK